jgi:hypothetical protein
LFTLSATGANAWNFCRLIYSEINFKNIWDGRVGGGVFCQMFIKIIIQSGHKKLQIINFRNL